MVSAQAPKVSPRSPQSGETSQRKRPRRGYLALLASAMVLASGIAVAEHVGDLPPVSQGGELAYVRDCPPVDLADGLDTRLECTYFAGTFDGSDTVTDYTSRGRFGDQTMFTSMEAPPGSLTGNLSFVRVDTYERGMMTGEGPAGQATFLNGVNAGVMMHAFEDTTLEWQAARGIEAELIDSNTVELTHDGHTYQIEVVGGSIEVDDGSPPMVEVDVRNNGEPVTHQEQPDEGHGPIITITLEEGGSVRGWLDGFSATSAVMHSEFDHELMADGLL